MDGFCRKQDLSNLRGDCSWRFAPRKEDLQKAGIRRNGVSHHFHRDYLCYDVTQKKRESNAIRRWIRRLERLMKPEFQAVSAHTHQGCRILLRQPHIFSRLQHYDCERVELYPFTADVQMCFFVSTHLRPAAGSSCPCTSRPAGAARGSRPRTEAARPDHRRDNAPRPRRRGSRRRTPGP